MPLRSSRAILVSVVILIGCGSAWFYLHGPQEPATVTHGLRDAPELDLKDHSGAEHRIEAFRGRAVLVHFWAAWCPPCLSEIPNLVAFARNVAAKSEPIFVVTVSEDEKWQDAEKVLPSASLPANMVSLLDVGSKVSDKYGTYQFPETYLVDTQGRIVTKWIGAQPWNNPKAEEFLLKQAVPGKTAGPSGKS